MKIDCFKSVCFVAFLCAPLVSWSLSCLNFTADKPTAISPTDFPQAAMWIGDPNNKFNKWAAETASKASLILSGGQKTQEVLAFVAEKRQGFELQVTYDHGNQTHRAAFVGVLREDAFADGDWTTEAWVQGAPATDSHLKLIGDIYTNNPVLLSPTRPVLQTHYKTLSGSREFAATSFVNTLSNWGTQSLKMYHPSLRISQNIMEDVYDRIDLFRKNKDVELFATAMQGYFHAMPYRGGSAGIGRSLSCVNLTGSKPSGFTLNHFPQSDMWMGKPNREFLYWATDLANTAADMLKAGEEAKSVLAYVASERRAFEEQVVYKNSVTQDRSQRVGVLRDGTATFWTTTLWSRGSLEGGRYKIAQDVYQENPALTMESHTDSSSLIRRTK